MTERNIRLLEPHELAEQGLSITRALPLELIDPNPHNPRRALVEIDALAENIKTFGLLQPVTVRRQAERFELIGGDRRLAAFKVLREREPYEPRWKSIDAVVRTMDDDTSYLALLSSQIHSRAWRPREEAAALERLAETRTLEEVGQLINKGKTWVGKRLRVYADSVLSGYAQSGRLVLAVAEELLLVGDPDVRKDFAERAVAEGWSREHARSEVRKLKAETYSDLWRRTLELTDMLSAVADPSRIPVNIFRDLQVLRGRIEQLGELARGGQPVFPPLKQASGKTAKTRRTRLRVD